MKTEEWISVKERLPDENRISNWNLVFIPSIKPGIQAAVFNRSNSWMCNGEDLTDVVTHWMPLPEPPQS